jgi:hypothetical protein
MADSIEQLSFELTSGVLSEQERAVSSLRVSAGTVLGAASIAASLVAARVSNGPLAIWALLAAISYALCFASAIWVVLPHEMVLSFGGTELMADVDSAEGVDVVEGYRAATGWIEPYLEHNSRTIDQLADCLTISCLTLAVEVLCCTIGLAS